MVPVVDLVEIGSGGGSIAWVDDFGKLRVGPQSAGAMPGPAAYGRGGTEATTTDANLALGRINKDFFCGGEIDADMAAVDAALGAVAEKLGTDQQGAARGVVRIANNNMINALKLISVNRGYDPRDFTLVAFGGGGGMHAVALATELGMQRVVIPRAADVFSAWGMLMTDLRRDYFVTRLIGLARRERGPARRAARRGDRDGARRSSRPKACSATRCASCATRACATRTRSTAWRSCCPRGRSIHRARTDRRGLPRVLRARVHVPARRGDRGRRRPSRRDRRDRQARAGEASRHVPVARRRPQGRARGRLRDRRPSRRGRLRRRPARARDELRGPRDRRDEGQHDRHPPGQPRDGRRVRQPPHHDLDGSAHDDSTPTRSRSRSSRARCSRSATRCSARCARPR